MPPSPQTNTQLLLGQYGAEIRDLREQIKSAQAGQEKILATLNELKSDMDEWKGASRTVIGAATLVAALLGATVSHFITTGLAKLFNMGA